MIHLLFSLLFTLTVLNSVDGAVVWRSLIPANSPLNVPDFQRFPAFSLSYTATGYGHTAFTSGLAEGLQPVPVSFPVTLAVDPANQRIFFNLTNSVYWWTATDSYAYVPQYNLCANRPGFSYYNQTIGYSQAIASGKVFGGVFKEFVGPAFDIGSCGYPVFSTFITTLEGYPTYWGFYETVNLEHVAGNVDTAAGGINFGLVDSGTPNANLFNLPAACASPPIDVCTLLGETSNFPAWAPFPGSAYSIPPP